MQERTAEQVLQFCSDLISTHSQKMFVEAHEFAATNSGDISPDMVSFLNFIQGIMAKIIAGQVMWNLPHLSKEGVKTIVQARKELEEQFHPVVKYRAADVVVVVRGGNVQGAWSSDPETNVIVKDFDNEPANDENGEIEKITDGMSPIL
jgi:hypothetical protein